MAAAKGKRMLLVDAMQHNKPERARFEDWKAGGVGCVHITLAIWETARETLSIIGKWHRLFEANADLIELARSADDVARIAASGRTAVIFGFQNASPFEDDIDLVRTFYELGVRISQLTYNIQNNVCAGCWEDNDSGVSKIFGRNLIREMNKFGILIDLSHTAEKSCLDAVELSERPVTFTHANPSEFVGFDIELNRRNKSTPLIKRMAERGGMMGLSMYPRIFKGGYNSTIDTFCDMISWTADKISVDNVGLGSDFYTGHPETEILWWRAGRFARESPVPVKNEFTPWPEWFRGPRDYPGVLEGMAKRGFKSDEIEKIAGGNWLRFFKESFGPKA